MPNLGLWAGIFLAVATTCLLASSFFIMAEIGEVNRKLPESEQISYL
jgi:hypothetical protein